MKKSKNIWQIAESLVEATTGGPVKTITLKLTQKMYDDLKSWFTDSILNQINDYHSDYTDEELQEFASVMKQFGFWHDKDEKDFLDGFKDVR